MSNFLDLLKSIPDPFTMTKNLVEAPFVNRGDAPWLQSTVRNLGRAPIGNIAGDAIDQHVLGDVKGTDGQLYYRGSDAPSTAGSAIQTPQLSSPQSAIPLAPVSTNPTQDAMTQLLKNWVSSQQNSQ